MAQDSDVPTSADKGKGKATEKQEDDKPVLNGKKADGDKKDGMRPRGTSTILDLAKLTSSQPPRRSSTRRTSS